jgi:L,D-peptidoglycan transpeptidase YkuD (ErfK/YbiS/YcfS/YnhG family)
MPNSPFNAKSSGILRWPGGEARCALGRSGVTPASLKREGDGASPLGSWPMRQIFFRPDRLDRPETALPADPMIPEAGWCDDPASPLYNRPVILPFAASHEQLWREDHVYDLIVVLGHNDDPPIPGMGSAIFLHIAREDFSPTEGCIACTLPDLLALLKVATVGDALEIVE